MYLTELSELSGLSGLIDPARRAVGLAMAYRGRRAWRALWREWRVARAAAWRAPPRPAPPCAVTERGKRVHRHGVPARPLAAQPRWRAPLYVAAAYVLVVRGKDVVLLRRAVGAPTFPGALDLPGGKLDAGESYRAAAARELAEETGLRVPPRALRAVHRWVPADKYHSAGVLFALHAPDYDGSVAEPDRFAGSAFVGLDEAVRLAACAATPFKPDVRRLLLDADAWAWKLAG